MKILIVRFSSIGDIVLTSPVVRSLRQQLKCPEIHYLTKEQFAPIVEENPRIDKVYTIEKSVDEVVGALRDEDYDWIIDLHNNIRTRSLKSKLRKPSKTVRKLNWKKWLLVKFKVKRMPKLHVVDRYFETVAHLGVKNDQKECEFYITSENEVEVEKELGLTPKKYIAIAIGAQFATKRLPTSKLIEILRKINIPFVLIGGPTDVNVAGEICHALRLDQKMNTCGKYNLQQSASIVKQSAHLLTHDTGMMHIASCFNVPMTTVWGNTVPDLGMYPYNPAGTVKASVHEVEGLSCRPCSKIGYNECPKKHFKCMMAQDVDAIAGELKL